MYSRRRNKICIAMIQIIHIIYIISECCSSGYDQLDKTNFCKSGHTTHCCSHLSSGNSNSILEVLRQTKLFAYLKLNLSNFCKFNN